MATGAYDANGIWQYGEDDNIALFSDLLNLGTESTSDAFTDDRARLATLEAGSLAGLIPINPSSIVVATGSAAVSSIGAVSFSGATSLTLNGVFSGAYKNYRVIVHTVLATDGWLQVRYGTSGSVNSGSIYAYGTFWSNGSTQIQQSSPNNQMLMARLATSSNINQALSMDIYSPQTTAYTASTGIFSNWYAGGGTSFGWVNASTQFTDLNIFPSSGSISGSISVYGYND